jgi:hypothetical protein
MSTTQAPEPTSYIVEGDSYRKLIAERDAYKRIANDLARQLRERTPADTNAPPERAAPETSAAPVVAARGGYCCDTFAVYGEGHCSKCPSQNRGVNDAR